MRRNAWVDLLLEDLQNPLCHIPTQVRRWSGHSRARADGAGRSVRVLDDHSALVTVGIDVEDRAPNLVNAVGWNHDCESASLGGPVIGSGVANRLKVNAVGVGALA